VKRLRGWGRKEPIYSGAGIGRITIAGPAGAGPVSNVAIVR
jgi:hypothetical protein